MNTTPTLLLVLPELWQLLFINILLLFALMFSSIQNVGRFNENFLYKAKWITPALQVEPVTRATILGFICSALLYYNNSLDSGFAFGLIWDDLCRFMSIFLCLSCAAALCLSIESLKRFSRYEFLLILWLSAVGMLCLIKSYSFLAVYLSIELQSLSFYMLTAMRSRTEASAEAGLKYFILSAFSSAMLLLGMTLIYGTVGCQSLGDLAMIYNHFLAYGPIYDHTYVAVYVGLGSICMSLLFKLAAAPLHAWIADVYEGSHTSITAWFAITAKIAVCTVLIRINTPDTYVMLLVLAAAASLIVGSLSAMRQVKLKRFIAFSAVSNAGWFLLALTAGMWQYMVLHLIVYTILSINLFSIFILPLLRTHPNLAYRTRNHNINTHSPLSAQKHEGSVDHGADSSTIKYISDLNQIYKVNPGLAFAIAMSMFSLAGIPPLAGFYSKYLIINAVSQSEQYLLLAIALAAAVISAFYYIRVVKTIYFSTPSYRKAASFTHRRFVPSEGWFTIQECPTNAYITAVTTGLTLVFFIKPEYFTLWLALI
jgi:proton-translocating NADH-quinone oxidoreductase chain N